MRAARTALAAITATLAAVALTGCAPDPNLTTVADELADVPNVTEAVTDSQHSNFPWETQVNIDLTVSDSSEEALLQTIRDIAPVLAEDPATSRFDTRIFFLDEAGDVYWTEGIFEEEFGLNEFLTVTFRDGDAQRIADGDF